MLPTTTLLLALTVPPGLQQTPDTAKPQPLFASHDILSLRLATDLETLVRDIGKHVGDNEFEGEQEHPATLWFVENETGAAGSLDIEVKTRGHFRRQRSTCNFPPLRIDVQTKAAAGTPFENQDKLKLVTHCQDKKSELEQVALMEYLLYRAYNLIDTVSYRVRLARMTYVDTAEKRDSLTRYAFLLEDDDMLAARLGGQMLEPEGPVHPLENLEPRTMTQVALFEFMAVNTDWDQVHVHNVKLLSGADGLVYVLPYDLDWAGMISAPYARPDPSLGISSVRDRLYRGFCRPEDHFLDPLDRFMAARESIYALFRDQDGLDENRRERAIEDLDRFYEIIGDPRRFKRYVLDRCRRL